MRAFESDGLRVAQARVTNREVAAIQRSYPKIYLACHTRHQRRRSNAANLTAHESSLLAHLSEDQPMRASDLAHHLGVGRSTLSAAIKRLTALGYIARTTEPGDGRAVALRLSPHGARAIQAGSILDSRRIQTLLGTLSAAERLRAIAGLELLADAATKMPLQTLETAMRWILWSIAGLVAIVGLVVLVGWMLPVSHEASSSAYFSQSPAQVYETVADVAEYASWLEGVSEIEMLGAPNGKTRFRQHANTGPVVMEIDEARPSSRFVTRIADPDQPFGGTWTFDFTPEGNGSRLTITERGEVYNPLFRYMARYVFGYTATMEGYLRSLKRRLGR